MAKPSKDRLPPLERYSALWPRAENVGDTFRFWWHASYRLLRDRGKDPQKAVHRAVRMARVQLLVNRGYRLPTIAKELGASERTVDYDRAMLRRVIREGWLEAVPDPPQPIPWTPESDSDWIVPPLIGRKRAETS